MKLWLAVFAIFGSSLLLPQVVLSQEPQLRVKSIKVIKNYGKSLDWSYSNNLILSEKKGIDGYYNIFVMNPDGSKEKNLTRRKNGCPQRHNGNAAWHPSGEYIVFTAQKEEIPETPEGKKFGIPGTGFNCDLWLMTSNGRGFHRLTNLSTERPVSAVIHPQFSHDGKKLFWSQRVSSGKDWGGWALKIADFVADKKNPRLENIQTYQLSKQPCFYESHAFSSDDKKNLFCANLGNGQPVFGIDIYEFEPGTRQLKNLTKTTQDWDEHAHYSPDGKKIVWMSSTGFDIAWGDTSGHKWQEYLKTELWIMDADGSNEQQLTHFNYPGYPEYMGGARCVVSDSSFSRNGKNIVALLAFETRKGSLNTKIVMIELE